MLPNGQTALLSRPMPSQSFAQAFRLARQVIGAEISHKDEQQLIEQFEAELQE